MRKTLALMAVVFTIGVTGAFDADAKRLGGAKSSGMQRQNVTAPNTPPTAARDAAGTPGTPAQAAAPAAATAAAAAPAAAAAKRSWMGPIAGLAAGLGIAALASHFGFGETLANLLTFALIAMAVLAVVGFILRKKAQTAAGSLAPAYGGAAGRTAFGQAQPGALRQTGSLIGSGLAGGASASTPTALPAGFDTASFERNAKQQFMALQAAHDAGDLDRLRDFLTPEMLEVAREDLRSRDGAQTTEVFGLTAQVLDVTTEDDRYIVSVRFTGSVRTQAGAAPDALDEVWHLTKPREGMSGWQVAGIQQLDA